MNMNTTTTLLRHTSHSLRRATLAPVLLALLAALGMNARLRPPATKNHASLSSNSKPRPTPTGTTGGANQGAGASQDVFVTELVKSGKFRVVEREQLSALMAEKNLALSGDIDPSTAVKAGRLLGVKYLLTGAITEYGASNAEAGARSIGGLPSFRVRRSRFSAAMNARLIDTGTGEIVWADEGRGETKSAKVRVSGIGGGVDDQAQFDRVLKPVVKDLVASLRAADI